MRFVLIGNPENRRIQLFSEACRGLGLAKPEVLSWESLIACPEMFECIQGCDMVRIDSPGENEKVATQLIYKGGGPQLSEMKFGRIAYLAEYHRGFCFMLDWIDQSNVCWMSSPMEIKTMFDKWESHKRFAQAELARPETKIAPDSLRLFHEGKGRKGRLFLKPIYGSSGSGVCAYRWNEKRDQMIAPIKIHKSDEGHELYNSLRIQKYESRSDIDIILGQLLPQGMIQEQWIPKVQMDNGVVDLRILVIDHEARHWVVRQSYHPMTNLHLGNRRAAQKGFIAMFGNETFRACAKLAEEAANCFPESLYAGVDILISRNGKPLVGEINAFGDLLPGLEDRKENSYAAIVNACLNKVGTNRQVRLN